MKDKLGLILMLSNAISTNLLNVLGGTAVTLALFILQVIVLQIIILHVVRQRLMKWNLRWHRVHVLRRAVNAIC